jgi:hypothetical protein
MFGNYCQSHTQKFQWIAAYVVNSGYEWIAAYVVNSGYEWIAAYVVNSVCCEQRL